MNTFKPHLKTLSRLSVVCLAAFLYAAAPAQAAPQTYTNSLGMEFVLIPAGSFMMACPAQDCATQPSRKVTITRPFYLGKYEVTQAQWEAVMGSNPSHFKGADRPVDSVNWQDVQTFILRLNQREGVKRYRLPTFAEWEYAALAGSTSPDDYNQMYHDAQIYAWHDGNSGNETHPVGQKQPNPWGLYDMHGNVMEFVWDQRPLCGCGGGFRPDEIEAQDPIADRRVNNIRGALRGCSWASPYVQCHAELEWYVPAGAHIRNSNHGFRLARSL